MESDLVRLPSRLGYLIYRAERLLRDRLDEALRELAVTTPEYLALSVLRNHDGLTCAQLARWACVTPQAMNLQVAALERRGLVSRVVDPDDRRALRASVTAAGHELLAACDRELDEIESEMLAGEDGELLRLKLSESVHALERARARQPSRDPQAAVAQAPTAIR